MCEVFSFSKWLSSVNHVRKVIFIPDFPFFPRMMPLDYYVSCGRQFLRPLVHQGPGVTATSPSSVVTAVFTTPSSWGDRWLFLFVLCIMTRTSRSHFFFPYKDKIFWDLALLLSVPFSICPLGFLSEALQYNLILWNFLRSTWRFQGKCTVGKTLKMFYAFLYPTCKIFTVWLP